MIDMTEQFIARFGQDAYDELCSVCLESLKSDNVYISSTHMHDAVNYTYLGVFTQGEDDVYFKLENGDWAGTELCFGEVVYDEPKPTRWVFVAAKEPDTPFRKRVHEMFLSRRDIKEMEGKMNYDLTFSPTNKIRDHYRKWAAARGMRITRQKESRDE